MSVAHLSLSAHGMAFDAGHAACTHLRTGCAPASHLPVTYRARASLRRTARQLNRNRQHDAHSACQGVCSPEQACKAHQAAASMLLIESKDDMRAWSAHQRAIGKRIGFVPTMGYLHKGHLELLSAARKHADVLVASIYVNPTQFSVHEDFGIYPRDREGDRRSLEAAGVDACFEPQHLYRAAGEGALVVGAPTSSESSHDTWVVPQARQALLCGKSRPHFFRGVATVVCKLFNIIMPDVAVFGRKDYQQWRIICAMVEDLDLPVRVIAADTVREEDGVACSSRNARLTAAGRSGAGSIYKSLRCAVSMVQQGCTDSTELHRSVADTIANAGGRVDYVQVVDAEHLSAVDILGHRRAVLAVAAYFPGKGGDPVRLIDNMSINEPINMSA